MAPPESAKQPKFPQRQGLACARASQAAGQTCSWRKAAPINPAPLKFPHGASLDRSRLPSRIPIWERAWFPGERSPHPHDGLHAHDGHAQLNGRWRSENPEAQPACARNAWPLRRRSRETLKARARVDAQTSLGKPSHNATGGNPGEKGRGGKIAATAARPATSANAAFPWPPRGSRQPPRISHGQSGKP